MTTPGPPPPWGARDQEDHLPATHRPRPPAGRDTPDGEDTRAAGRDTRTVADTAQPPRPPHAADPGRTPERARPAPALPSRPALLALPSPRSLPGPDAARTPPVAPDPHPTPRRHRLPGPGGSLPTGLSTDRAPAPLWEVAVDDVPVSVSARGDLVAVATAGGTVSVLAAATGDTLDSLSLPGGALRVELAPDAENLMATGPMGHALWNRRTGRSDPHTGVTSADAAWSADGARVAIASGHRVLVLDAQGRELWRTDDAGSPVTGVVWMPQGRLAVAASGRVRTHEADSGHPVGTYACAGQELALAVAPNGKWVCAGNADAAVHVWRTLGGSSMTVRGYPEQVSRLAFDETGYWLATDGAPDVTVWDFSRNGPTGAPRRLRCHRTVTALAWRPGTDGHLASGGQDGTVALWYATSGQARSYLSPARLLDPGPDTEPDRASAGPYGADEVTALAWAGPRRLVTARRHGRIRAHELPGRSAL